MSSVLYDAPGPLARRREAIGSVVGAIVLVAAIGGAIWYAAGNDVFAADRWDVLYDPPKGQSAADVWRSMVVKGLGATLRAAALAAPLALVLGLGLSMMRTSHLAWLRVPAIGIIEVFRGLPVLLMMYFGLIGMGLETYLAVAFGLTVYNMAVISEILRSGLAALPKGQTEAALAIGLTRWQTLIIVQLPQAVRIMLPSLIAQLIVLLKDSSLGFIVGYPELLKSIQNNVQYFGNRYYVALFVVGLVLFLAVNLSLSALARRLQRRSPGARRLDAAPAGAGGGA